MLKNKIFTEKYFRENEGRFTKIKERNCKEIFEIWRVTKKEVNEEYDNFLKIITEIKTKKVVKRKLIKKLRRAIKSFFQSVYAYKEKTKKFLNCYLGKKEFRNKWSQRLYNLIINHHFWVIFINFFIKLHNSHKHSGFFKILFFNYKKKGKDFYIINFSIKDNEDRIENCLNGGDIIHYAKKAKTYLEDVDERIFHFMIRRS